jgi:MFS family permease
MVRGTRLAGRPVLFALLYASEGAPIGFIWWALPTVLRSAGLPIAQITGLTALLVLPWVFKFTWAPLVDRLRTPRWGFRSWIVSAQLVMGLALVPLIWLDPVGRFETWRMLLLVHAFAAATQDVAIDAYAISVVPARQLGWLNGSMQAGMLVGRSVFGGGALVVLAVFGHEAIVAALVAWIWVVSIVLLGVRGEPGAPPIRTPGRFRQDVARALARPTTWWGLAFALTSAAAFEATGQLAGPFLLDRGVSQEAIGVFFGAAVVGATLAGGLVGGRLSDRWGRLRACAVFLGWFVAAVLALGAVDLLGVQAGWVRLALLAAMYFGVGLFTAASYALFMDLTDPAIGGTQFSAFMSATNACESWSAWAGGRLAGQSGYPAAFLVMSAASLIALPVLWRLGRAISPRSPLRTAGPTSPS